MKHINKCVQLNHARGFGVLGRITILQAPYGCLTIKSLKDFQLGLAFTAQSLQISMARLKLDFFDSFNYVINHLAIVK
jgi:hypothetical protein